MEKRLFESAFRKEWLLDLPEYTVITRKILLEFYVPDLEADFVSRLIKSGVKVERVSRLDPRLNRYNCIDDEIVINPGKKVWHIVKTSALKRALLTVGGTRISGEIKRHYQEMEDCLRKALVGQREFQNNKELVSATVEEAVRRMSDIIDEKIINRLQK